MLPPEDHILEGTPEEIDRKLRRLSSIGKPLADVEVLIVDEAGEPVATGETGEIVARGSRMMRGYWQQAVATGRRYGAGGFIPGIWRIRMGTGISIWRDGPRISSSGAGR